MEKFCASGITWSYHCCSSEAVMWCANVRKVSPVLLLFHKARECCLLPQVGENTFSVAARSLT